MTDFFPDVKSVLECLVEGLAEIREDPHAIPKFSLDFYDIGTYTGQELRGGLGHLALVKSTHYPLKDLNWIGIKKATGIDTIKEFVYYVDRLENGWSQDLFLFFDEDPIEHPKWCIRLGELKGFELKENALEMLETNLRNIAEKL